MGPTSRCENKWHEKLKTFYTTVVWDKIYTLPTKFLVPNKQIWTQIQINKYLLPTNYTVSFYDRKVPSLCSFCNLHPEHLHFLIWDCKVVQMFWVIINNFILNFCPRFCLGAKEAIFGDTNSGGDSLVNSILVLARYFIYQQKFTTKTLDEVNFFNFFRAQLTFMLQKVKKKFNERVLANEWSQISELFGVNFSEGSHC